MRRWWCARIIFPLPKNFSGNDIDAAILWLQTYQAKLEARKLEGEYPQRFKVKWWERLLFARSFAGPMRRIKKGINPNGECYFAVRPVRELKDMAWVD